MLIPTGMGRASRLPHLDFFILILRDCLGVGGAEERLTPWCFIYLYDDLYQMHPLPLGLLVYLNPAVSMYSK